MEWQPIETAPRDGTYILLVICEDSSISAGEVHRGCLIKSALWGDCWQFNGSYTITADEGAEWWMPLPEPPKTCR